MTGIHNLTPEQETFAAHIGGAFVNACPGAGKTRTIIARLARIAATLPPRQGIAILSFTNSAVDEFRERCLAAGLDTLLQYPSFMGTLDAFVRHFVVLPLCGIKPDTTNHP
jgi:ATP-dependent exoDNAse (exonuclease V) beta subunit